MYTIKLITNQIININIVLYLVFINEKIDIYKQFIIYHLKNKLILTNTNTNI